MKSKNTEIVPYTILSVVGVVLVGMMIYFMINSTDSIMAAAKDIVEDNEEVAADFLDYDIAKYDGEVIRGSEVVNFIKEQLGDYETTETAPIYVEVIKMRNEITYTNTYTNKTYILDIKNFTSSDHYIKPTAWFTFEVVMNTNKAILGVRITQK